jgi:hypothetical protein
LDWTLWTLWTLKTSSWLISRDWTYGMGYGVKVLLALLRFVLCFFVLVMSMYNNFENSRLSNLCFCF